MKKLFSFTLLLVSLILIGCQQKTVPTVTVSEDFTSVTTEGETAPFPCDFISAAQAGDILGFAVEMDEFYMKSTAASLCGYYSNETGNGVAINITQFSVAGGEATAKKIYEDGKQYTPSNVTALPSLSSFGDASYGYEGPLTTDLQILKGDMVINLGVSGDKGSEAQREKAVRELTELLLKQI